MKSILLLLVLIIFTSCSEDPSGIVENSNSHPGISEITFPDTVYYNSSDSTVALNFKTQSSIQSASFSLFTIDGKFTVYNNQVISGDKEFQYTLAFSKSYPNSIYQLEVYLVYDDGIKRLALIKNFYYSTNTTNKKPLVNELTLPSSINRGELFTFMASISDPNGLGDINSVKYRLYMPDGNLILNSQGITDFPMFDDGQTNVNGDTTANDGIYTSRFVFPSSSQTGNWKLEVYAEDRGGLVSDVVSKTFEVK